MGFAPKRFWLPTLVVLSTAILFLVGNSLNPWWPAMWVAPLPVLLFALAVDSWWTAAASAALGMLLGSLSMLYYLHGVLRLPVSSWAIPFTAASLIFAVGVLLFRALFRRGAIWGAIVVLPALWAVCEYLTSFVPANGTAGSLAYTQLRFLPFLQLASITGPWGMTFLLLLFPAGLAAGLTLRATAPRKATAVLAVVVSLVLVTVLFGVVRLRKSDSSETVRVGLLVTDTVQIADPGAPAEKLLRDYAAHAEQLARQGAQIIVMPEKTAVLLDENASAVDEAFQSVSNRTRSTLVIGVVHVAKHSSYNEARIYTPLKPIVTYEKQHMLPPFESDLTPGTSLTFLPDSQKKVGVAICKDMDFIRPALDYGRAGIALLLDPAWDFNVDRSWHGHIAIMRGVEGGYAIAHASKDGFLTVTDNRGRILGEVSSGDATFAALLVNAPLHHNNTVFDHYGAWFPWIAGVLLLMALVQLAVPLGNKKSSR